MSSNTLGHVNDYPDPIPVNPRFLKKCSTHPNDEDVTIDPTSKEASLAKETSDGKIQCYHCQVRELKDVMLKRLPPNDPKVRDIITRRQLALSKKLIEDERRHQRS